MPQFSCEFRHHIDVSDAGKHIEITAIISCCQLNRTKLKKQISTRENVAVAFADAAAEHSSCPSGRKGSFNHCIDGLKVASVY